MMVRNVLGPILGAVMAALVANCSEGCKPIDSPTEGDAYTAELQLCVAKAKTREESLACRKAMDEKYHVCEQFPDMCLVKPVLR